MNVSSLKIVWCLGQSIDKDIKVVFINVKLSERLKYCNKYIFKFFKSVVMFEDMKNKDLQE